jgi:hypothetical protein
MLTASIIRSLFPSHFQLLLFNDPIIGHYVLTATEIIRKFKAGTPTVSKAATDTILRHFHPPQFSHNLKMYQVNAFEDIPHKILHVLLASPILGKWLASRNLVIVTGGLKYV